MTAWVYVQSEPALWTVGHYDPTGKWHAESDHDTQEDAAHRCAWLNGSPIDSASCVHEAIRFGKEL